MGIITNSMSGVGDKGQQIIEVYPGSATTVTITDEQVNLIKAAPEKVIIRSKYNASSKEYTDYLFNNYGSYYYYSSAQVRSDNKVFGCYVNVSYKEINFTNRTYQNSYYSAIYIITDSHYRSTDNAYHYFGNIIDENGNYKITINADITHTDANLRIPIPSGYWVDSNQLTKVTIVKGNSGYDTILIPVKGLNTGEPTIYLSLDKDSGIATILIEESPNPTCYDTNETIDFTAIMAEYLADTTKSGKIRPFTSSDTLLSADSIKKIIDGNYKMFSFNAKIGEQVMKAYMPISYHSEANSSNYYTFKGQVTFLNSGAWNTIDVQMQFIHNSTAGTYTNNPGYGFFKYTAETAISA